MCNQCADPLKGSEYYEITCRDTNNIKTANDHDIEERVKKIEDESNQHNIDKKEDANEEQIIQLRKKISELHKEANIRKGVYDCYV